MVNTNELLSIALTLISNFTSVVQVPEEGVPHKPEDLRRVTVGSPLSPLDLWLVQNKGYEFWIRNGVVNQYLSPDSYFTLQDISSASRLAGNATLRSNQVIELAKNTLTSLAGTNHPLANINPIVKTPARKDMPFYQITWSASDNPLVLPIAEIEIDASRRRVVALAIWGRGYFDPSTAGEISNRVYKAEPRPKSLAKSARDPATLVPTSEVRELIPKWLAFCRTLELDPGTKTNLAEVDWDSTFKSAAPAALGHGTLYVVHFRNGTMFETMDQTVFGHACSDAGFTGAWAEKPADYWNAFLGTPTNKWQDLAKGLEERLTTKMRVSRADLSRYVPMEYVHGVGGVSRCVVCWYERKDVGKKPLDSVRTGLWVEFDLATGRVKNLAFHDINILNPKETLEGK